MIAGKTTDWPGSPDCQPVEPQFSPVVPEQTHVKVLVVDDEPLIRWAVTEFLSDLGYQVIQAGDAESAIAAVAESAPFEIVLLDVRLPDSDDLLLLTRLRSLTPEARIILMTAHATHELAERAINLGAFTVVDKPFELTDLAALVSRASGAGPSFDASARAPVPAG
jgi:DNA-binding NtrC family response regulator